MIISNHGFRHVTYVKLLRNFLQKEQYPLKILINQLKIISGHFLK